MLFSSVLLITVVASSERSGAVLRALEMQELRMRAYLQAAWIPNPRRPTSFSLQLSSTQTALMDLGRPGAQSSSRRWLAVIDRRHDQWQCTVDQWPGAAAVTSSITSRQVPGAPGSRRGHALPLSSCSTVCHTIARQLHSRLSVLLLTIISIPSPLTLSFQV